MLIHRHATYLFTTTSHATSGRGEGKGEKKTVFFLTNKGKSNITSCLIHGKKKHKKIILVVNRCSLFLFQVMTQHNYLQLKVKVIDKIQIKRCNEIWCFIFCILCRIARVNETSTKETEKPTTPEITGTGPTANITERVGKHVV